MCVREIYYILLQDMTRSKINLFQNFHWGLGRRILDGILDDFLQSCICKINATDIWQSYEVQQDVGQLFAEMLHLRFRPVREAGSHLPLPHEYFRKLPNFANLLTSIRQESKHIQVGGGESHHLASMIIITITKH